MKEEKEGGRNKGMQISILSGQKFPNFHHELKTVCDSKKKKKTQVKMTGFQLQRLSLIISSALLLTSHPAHIKNGYRGLPEIYNDAISFGKCLIMFL